MKAHAASQLDLVNIATPREGKRNLHAIATAGMILPVADLSHINSPLAKMVRTIDRETDVARRQSLPAPSPFKVKPDSEVRPQHTNRQTSIHSGLKESQLKIQQAVTTLKPRNRPEEPSNNKIYVQK